MELMDNPAFLVWGPLNLCDARVNVFFEEESDIIQACTFLFPAILTFLELATDATVQTLLTDKRPPGFGYMANTWNWSSMYHSHPKYLVFVFLPAMVEECSCRGTKIVRARVP
jgi:hypothetical protein